MYSVVIDINVKLFRYILVLKYLINLVYLNINACSLHTCT